MVESFIGAGKIMYNNTSLDYNIPHLHFLVSRTGDEYLCTVIEFGLYAAGRSIEKSIAESINLTTTYLDTVLRDGRGFDELIERAVNPDMNGHWQTYREIEFKAALVKKDIGHDVEQRIRNEIAALFKKQIDRRVKELLAAYDKDLQAEISKLIENANKYSCDILYQGAA